MKVLKFFGLAFVLMNFAFFSAPLFLDKEFSVTRTHEFNIESKHSVFEYLADFNNHPKWNPWFRMDSTMKFEISEPSRGLGASYSWKSDEAAHGSQKIVEFVEGKKIGTYFDFGEMGSANGSWELKQSGENLLVTWKFWGPANGYIARYMAHFMDEMMQPMMQVGFDSLSSVAAHSPIPLAITETIMADSTMNSKDSLKVSQESQPNHKDQKTDP